MKRVESNRIRIMGIPLDRVNYEDACGQVEVFLEAEGAKSIVTPNAEIVMMAQEDSALKAALLDADLCFPDGIGVVLASKILGDPLKGRTAGFDLVIKLLEMLHRRRGSVFLLGGKPGVAELAAVNIKIRFPQISIAGTHHGYFAQEEESRIVEEINAAMPSLLLVALGAPKQEIFMKNHKGRLQCGVMMGVGGSLDVISGKAKRAPVFWQRVGLEWLYRLINQPSRIKRVMVLPVFMWRVIGLRVSQIFRGS